MQPIKFQQSPNQNQEPDDDYVPMHLFLGLYPLTFGVRCICFIHFLLCVALVGCCSSVMPLSLGGMIISTLWQEVFGAWSLIGCTLIMGAVVCTFTRHEFGLRMYFFYGLSTDVCLAVALVGITTLGSECAWTSDSTETQRIGMSFPCAMASATAFFVVLSLLSVALYASYVVWHLWECIRAEYASDRVFQREEAHEMGKALAQKKILEPRTKYVTKPYGFRGLGDTQGYNSMSTSQFQGFQSMKAF